MTRLEHVLKERFGRGPEGFKRCMAALGLDSDPEAYLRKARKRKLRHGEPVRLGYDSKSYMKPKGVDTADLRAFLRARGIEGDDMRKAFDLMGLDFEDDWAMEQAAQHGHSDHRMGGEDDEESEERLKSEKNMRRSSTNYNRRDESEADRREMRNSVQSEDNINANRVHGGKGGRWAGGMDGLRELIQRVGVDNGSRPAHAKETGPSNFDGGGVEDRLRFLKKLDRLAAR